MNVIVCLGDNNELLFNNRRVSKDINIFNDIFTYTDKIYVDKFSTDMINFYNIVDKVIYEDVNKIKKDQFYLNEVYEDIYPVENLIVYYFNRSYPQDLQFKINDDLILISESEFVGYSHDLITKKVYRCINERN